MPGAGARGAAGLLLAAALAAVAGCGKKAPLRLPDQVRPEEAAPLRASVSGDTVTLRLRTPARRLFPEREEPWVLARILRRSGPDPEFGEAGEILEADGLPFDSELVWSDPGRAAGVAHVYRVEFRDARRRRRALTRALVVSWQAAPGAVRALTASGSAGAVALAWEAPEGAPAGVKYRVLRREAAAGEAGALPGAEVAATFFLDSRVVPGREYCYRVLAFVEGTGAQVEGPASAEACASAEGVEPAPAPPGR